MLQCVALTTYPSAFHGTGVQITVITMTVLLTRISGKGMRGLHIQPVAIVVKIFTI